MCEEESEWGKSWVFNSSSESSLKACGLQSMKMNHILSCCKSPRHVLVLATITDEYAEARVN